MKTNYFDFNHENYNFWPLYETITKYYPIGIPYTGNSNSLYLQYPGMIALGDLITKHIYDKKNYKRGWLSFKSFLRAELGKPIIGTESLAYPCLSGFILLKKKQKNDFTQQKELHFALSLLGSFYTIYGMDTTELKLVIESNTENIKDQLSPPDSRFYSTVHAVTVSPYLEYEQSFLALQAKILERFQGYKFVPYEIYTMRIKGLEANGDIFNPNSSKGTIYTALFNDNLNMKAETRGDEYYGYKDWIKSNYHS